MPFTALPTLFTEAAALGVPGGSLLCVGVADPPPIGAPDAALLLFEGGLFRSDSEDGVCGALCRSLPPLGCCFTT